MSIAGGCCVPELHPGPTGVGGDGLATSSPRRGMATQTSQIPATSCSRSTRRRLLRKGHHRAKVLGAARALCELERGAGVDLHPDGDPQLSAEEWELLERAVEDLGQPPPELTARGAFAELQGAEDYAGDRCDLAPLDVERLSLPSPGFPPKALPALLAGGSDYIQRSLDTQVLPKSEPSESWRTAACARCTLTRSF